MKADRAALEAGYAPGPGEGSRPPSDDTFTIVPEPRARMEGSTASVAATGAKKLTSKVRRKSSTVMSVNRTPGSCAALLMRRSIPPSVSITSRKVAHKASVSATLQTIVREAGEMVRSSSDKVARRAALRERSMTVAPARAKSPQSCRPSPADAPVTTATRSR